MRAVLKREPYKNFVALKRAAPGVGIELRYGTANNFTHTVLYAHPVACLRAAPANALRLVQEELARKGYGLKVYDAYRPFSVTCRIWGMTKEKKYVANPKKGSHHNRGCAVDVTLTDAAGRELDMGTQYDDFTDSAHHSFTNLPPAVLGHRRLLKATMRKYGFGMVPDEWWHYQWFKKADYEIVDLNFDDLEEFIK